MGWIKPREMVYVDGSGVDDLFDSSSARGGEEGGGKAWFAGGVAADRHEDEVESLAAGEGGDESGLVKPLTVGDFDTDGGEGLRGGGGWLASGGVDSPAEFAQMAGEGSALGAGGGGDENGRKSHGWQ